MGICPHFGVRTNEFTSILNEEGVPVRFKSTDFVVLEALGVVEHHKGNTEGIAWKLTQPEERVRSALRLSNALGNVFGSSQSPAR